MQYSINGFIKICKNTLPIKDIIYEFGSFIVEGHEHIADLRPIFEGMKYVGTDMREGKGVDEVMNYQDLPLESNSISTAISCETLEHTEYPRKAMSEMHRVLKDNGICIITSMFKFPLHDYPYDYFRYSEEGFRSLLSEFDSVYVASHGADELYPTSVIGIGVKGKKNFFDDKEKFKQQMIQWKNKYGNMQKRGKLYNDFVPIFIRLPWKYLKLAIRKVIIIISPNLHKKIISRKIYNIRDTLSTKEETQGEKK